MVCSMRLTDLFFVSLNNALYDLVCVHYAGWDSFIWNGTRPKVNITKPEDVKEIFNQHDDFHKVLNPITALLVSGFAIHEGERWAKPDISKAVIGFKTL